MHPSPFHSPGSMSSSSAEQRKSATMREKLSRVPEREREREAEYFLFPNGFTVLSPVCAVLGNEDIGRKETVLGKTLKRNTTNRMCT